MSKIFNNKSKLLLTAVIPLALIMALSIGSYADSIGVTTIPSVQGLAGVQYNVAGGLSVTNPSFTLTQSNATATATTWSDTGTIATALTAGHWQFQITVTSKALADASHTVTVSMNTGSGYVDMPSITFSGITADSNTMTFVFDAGTGPNAGNTAIIVTIT